MTNPSYTQLVQAISAILPAASFGEDNEGQLLIYTNLVQTNKDDNFPLTEFVPE